MVNKQQKEALTRIIDKAVKVEIESTIDFSFKQLDLIKELNSFSANQILDDEEVLRDPRKIIYKTNHELQFALVALCLSRSLINPCAKKSHNKEFFQANISISSGDYDNKIVSFGKIEEAEVIAAIHPEIVYDWMLYRDKAGRGINALMDTKAHLNTIESYQRGGDPQYEFARFERKYTEEKYKKVDNAKESAQESFRNIFVQTAATEIVKKQLQEGRDPMELVKMLFATEDYNEAIKALTTNVSSKEPQTKLLEFSQEKDSKTRER